MIPIEYLWYIIGAVSVPVFIMLFLKALRRNREDKARVALRRKRFERQMKSPAKPPAKNETLKRAAPTAIEIPRDNPSGEAGADEHWLSGVKLPTKRDESETSGHWLETIKPKRNRHWLEYLRR